MIFLFPMSSDQSDLPSPMTDLQLEHELDNFLTHESRPLNVLQEYIQPIEITILEYIHNNEFNHKLYNLIQNTRHDFSLVTEQLTICLQNSSHHPTKIELTSPIVFSLMTTLRRYDYNYFN